MTDIEFSIASLDGTELGALDGIVIVYCTFTLADTSGFDDVTSGLDIVAEGMSGLDIVAEGMSGLEDVRARRRRAADIIMVM